MNTQTNIWHKLAENALNGKYNPGHSSVSDHIPFNAAYDKIHTYWVNISAIDGWFYEDMDPEEQCLFLLFCGESYED